MMLSREIDGSDWLGPPEKDKDACKREIIKLVSKNGGQINVAALSALYESSPWIAKTVGRLQTYCDTHAGELKYTARGKGVAATLALVPNAVI